jgi:hypothetical protein
MVARVEVRRAEGEFPFWEPVKKNNVIVIIFGISCNNDMQIRSERYRVFLWSVVR